MPEPWPATARDALVSLARRRPTAAIPVWEALDQADVVEPAHPGVGPSSAARPQRNPVHRFTVDRHLVDAGDPVVCSH